MKKVLFFIVSILFLSYNSFGQGCALCTKTASELGGHKAESLNAGIIYLALIPITFIGVIGFIWYKKNKTVIEE